MLAPQQAINIYNLQGKHQNCATLIWMEFVTVVVIIERCKNRCFLFVPNLTFLRGQIRPWNFDHLQFFANHNVVMKKRILSCISQNSSLMELSNYLLKYLFNRKKNKKINMGSYKWVKFTSNAMNVSLVQIKWCISKFA